MGMWATAEEERRADRGEFDVKSDFAPGFDIDGVVADTSRYIIEHEYLDPALNKTWNWSTSYGHEMSKVARGYYGRPEIWVGAEPMEGAPEGFAEFRASPHWTEPVWITNIDPDYVQLRLWWLHKHFGGYPTGSILTVRHPEEKVALAKKLHLTHFVEDKLQTANAMAEAGLRSYLIESSYMTDDGTLTVHPGVVVVSSFRAAIRDILSELASHA